MSRRDSLARDSLAYVAIGPALVWAALIEALAVSIFYAFLGGPAPLVVNLLIATGMGVTVAILFMRLSVASPLIRLAAVAALLWLLFMFSLSFADYMTRRPGAVPPCQRLGEPCARAEGETEATRA